VCTVPSLPSWPLVLFPQGMITAQRSVLIAAADLCLLIITTPYLPPSPRLDGLAEYSRAPQELHCKTLFIMTFALVCLVALTCIGCGSEPKGPVIHDVPSGISCQSPPSGTWSGYFPSVIVSYLVFLFLILGVRFTDAEDDRSFSTRAPGRPPADRPDIGTLCLFAPLPHTGSSGNGNELGWHSSATIIRSGALCAKHCRRTRA